MKRVAVLFAVPVLCVLLLAGCAEVCSVGAAEVRIDERTEEHVVITVAAGDEDKSLYDALAVFREEGKLSFTATSSEYGYYITEFEGKAADEGHFWAIYTSVGTVDGVDYSSAEYGTYLYGEQTLSSASFGVSGMPLFAGAVYALVWTEVSY